MDPVLSKRRMEFLLELEYIEKMKQFLILNFEEVDMAIFDILLKSSYLEPKFTEPLMGPEIVDFLIRKLQSKHHIIILRALKCTINLSINQN